MKTLRSPDQAETLADALLDVVDALEASGQAQLRAFEGRVAEAISVRVAAGAARLAGIAALSVAWAMANAAGALVISRQFNDVAALLTVSFVHAGLAILLLAGARRFTSQRSS